MAQEIVVKNESTQHCAYECCHYREEEKDNGLKLYCAKLWHNHSALICNPMVLRPGQKCPLRKEWGVTEQRIAVDSNGEVSIYNPNDI